MCRLFFTQRVEGSILQQHNLTRFCAAEGCCVDTVIQIRVVSFVSIHLVIAAVVKEIYAPATDIVLGRIKSMRLAILVVKCVGRVSGFRIFIFNIGIAIELKPDACKRFGKSFQEPVS
jgi:hypothetical protein